MPFLRLLTEKLDNLIFGKFGSRQVSNSISQPEAVLRLCAVREEMVSPGHNDSNTSGRFGHQLSNSLQSTFPDSSKLPECGSLNT